MRRMIAGLALCLLAALPAAAGYRYRTVMTVEGAGQPTLVTRTEGWVSEGRTKVVFEESGNPLIPAGSYLVIPDAETRRIFLVNPQEKTYSEWNLDAMAKLAGDVMEGLGPLAKFELVDPKVETLLEEDGGSRFGLDLTHYRFRTSYDMQMKILGMKQSNRVTQITDGYYTEDLDDAAFGVWLRPIKTGNEEIDKLIELEMSKARGFPIKTVVEDATVNKKGKEQVTRTTIEVTELEPADPDDGMFTFPADYTPTPLFPLAADGIAGEGEGEGEEEEDGKKKKGLLGRIRGDG